MTKHGLKKQRLNTYKKPEFLRLSARWLRVMLLVGGASLGGWLSLMAACRFPDKVKGVFGLAAAPDFLKKYIEDVILHPSTRSC